ncbi:MAG: tRNA lysidine(34) synthetase TilS [Aristaeellaceae bacterium]
MDSMRILAARLPEMPGHVLAGVSGGADSVALLLMLLAKGCRVTAVHVNHGLRCAESDADEAFVRALCRDRNVPLLCFRASPPEHPGEDWARAVRYGFFREAMAQSQADALVLAHHRDDQAETLLLHLLRGAGLTGLTAMAADTTVEGMRILRPLLDVSRAELQSALLAAGQPWREDSSNQDSRYLRNAVRHELLPLMERLAPGCGGRLAATATLLREDEATLRALSEAFLLRHPGPELPLSALTEQPEGLRARILRSWWQREAGAGRDERSLSRAQTASLAALMAGRAGEKCNLPGDWQGYRGWTHLHLTGPGKAAPPAETPVVLPRTVLGDITLEAAPPGSSDGCLAQTLPRAMLAGTVLRTRRPGDWLRPYGSGGRQSLQDYFVNRHVDAPFRERVPLLCRGSEVLLAAGVGAGDIPPEEEQCAPVRLHWLGGMPWHRPQGTKGKHH